MTVVTGRDGSAGRRRVFVAIVPPVELKAAIRRALEPLSQEAYPFRWLDPASYHVTLKFLGDVTGERIDELWRVARGVIEANRAFPLSAGRVGAFPTLRKPRVLWVEMEATPEMRNLKQDLEWEFSKLGFEREARTFHPHVTVARAQARSQAGDFRDLALRARDVCADAGPTASIRSVELLETLRAPGGVRYEAVASAGLAPGEDAGEGGA